MKKVCILNYGSGNINSVFNLISLLEQNVIISNEPADIENSSHLILPGVGAFGSSMKKIKKTIPLQKLMYEVLMNKKPFLGICVGMQILADKGLEFGEHEGLGWIPGIVEKLSTNGNPLPHIGWNNISIVNNSILLKNIPEEQDFYFVHSYAFVPADQQNIIAETDYGDKFTSIIQKENIYGVQFHPEKSQKMGKQLLRNFLEQQ